MRYLIDTNVISELRKGKRSDANVQAWFDGFAEDEVFLSVLTIGELRRGIENIRRRNKKSARRLERWLDHIVLEYGDRILPIDSAIADEWGRLNVPDPLPVVDGLLAATARIHDLTIATRDTKDIAPSGAKYLNPFEDRG